MLTSRMLLGLAILLWGAAFARIGAAIRFVQHTSLQATCGWGLVAAFAWLVSSVLMLLIPANRPLLDQFGMWTAILTLCPLISALGARRPTSRVWNWFIIVPLIAVLGWPALVVLADWPDVPPLRIQAPVFVAFAVVLAMGVGNYLATRFMAAALLAGGFVVLSLLPLSSSLEISDPVALTCRTGAALTAVWAALSASRPSRRSESEISPIDRLWFDFWDTFGIVWSIRIQERLNAAAAKEGWGARLGPHGFEWDSGVGGDRREETQARIEHALRWHLRRFVDPEWIDRRLGH